MSEENIDEILKLLYAYFIHTVHTEEEICTPIFSYMYDIIYLYAYIVCIIFFL